MVLAAGHDHLLTAISVGAAILVVKVFYILLLWVLPDGRGTREIGDFRAILHDLGEDFPTIERAGAPTAIVKQA